MMFNRPLMAPRVWNERVCILSCLIWTIGCNTNTEIFHQIDNFEFHVQKICDLQINKGFVYLIVLKTAQTYIDLAKK